MPLFAENFGLEFLMEDEKILHGFMCDAVEKGKEIKGYYGLPYLNCTYGDVQIVLRTQRRQQGDGLEVVGMDSHAAGSTVWEVRLSAMNLDPPHADKLSRRVVATRPDESGGMAVINLVNADVLPSFLEGDVIKLQVAAFPEHIEYFADEDAYADFQPAMKNGGKFLLDEGSVFPAGLMQNRNPQSPHFESDESLDNLVNVRATVKALRYGQFAMDGDEHDAFVYCIVDTKFGPLEIIHGFSQVDEAQRENMRGGAVVNFYGTLSGDAAIYAYEKGIVRDEEHALAAFRYMFRGNDPERLRQILSQNAVYLAEYNGKSYVGPDAIIQRLKFVQEDHTQEYFAHMATIVSVDGGEETLPYGVGKRCIVLASGEETNYTSIAFLEVDGEGNVSRLLTSTNPRYHFDVDEKPERSFLFDDPDIPRSVIESILARARFEGMLDSSVTDEMVLQYSAWSEEFENNARQMLNALPEDKSLDRDSLLENLYGYLFAKAAEMEYAANQYASALKGGLLCSYTPDDAWAGRIESTLDAERQAKLEDAFALGRQFYQDFALYQKLFGAGNYDGDMMKSLMAVQNLGCFYSRKCLDW